MKVLVSLSLLVLAVILASAVFYDAWSAFLVPLGVPALRNWAHAYGVLTLAGIPLVGLFAYNSTNDLIAEFRALSDYRTFILSASYIFCYAVYWIVIRGIVAVM